MELAQFYSVLIVQLVSVLAGAACLSVYLVSRRRTFLYAFWAFLFYFFDVTLVFQDSFVSLAMNLDLAEERVYLVLRSFASIVSGCGIFVSLWLLACDFVGEKRKALLFTPGVLFVAGSLATLLLEQGDPTARFAFYAMRAALFVWTLVFLGARYFSTHDETERTRMKRYRLFYAVLWAFGIGFILEDVYGFLLAPQNEAFLLFSAERNYMEEALMLVCAAVACASAYRALSLRYEHPPVRNNDERVESMIDGNLEIYGKKHKLSKREQEVLRLVLTGLDNQNIASTMGVAPSTAKVHVHNILRKTGHANRQDLIQDFWSTW